MTARTVVAVDLGAESGRVVVGRFEGTRVELTEAIRFPNGPRPSAGLLRWDTGRLWREIRTGLARAAESAGQVDSVGVDTWGLDYGLLDAAGAVLDEPVAYRDPRTRGMLAAAVQAVGRERLYGATGIQLLEVNTVFQLLAEVRAGGERLARASRLLMMPDLFHHLLCGARVAELTAASTSGAYDVARGAWATGLLDDLGIPTHMLPEVVPAGTALGRLRPEVAADSAGLAGTTVVTPGSHDTASAVAGTPLTDPGAAYISSGTWSLVGVETAAPVITEAARAANLTNEGGVAGTNRLLRNVMGLWLLQECRRQWAREGTEYRYDELVTMAAGVPAGGCFVNPDHPDFVAPGDMPARVREYCRRTGQPAPDSVPALARCVLESLALSYRSVFEDLALVTGQKVPHVHIVGGGSRNGVLNRLTAAVSGLPVRPGPAEATALGNVLVQLGSLGELRDLAQMREVVRGGGDTGVVEPEPDPRWDEIHARFRTQVAEDLASQGLGG